MSRYLISLRSSADKAKALESKACAWCGSVFYRDKRNTWKYWDLARFCTSACAGKEHSARSERMRPDKQTAFAKWFKRADEGCWQWQGARDRDGYGIFSYAGKTFRAPVVALEFDGRPVPKGMYACHHCDNPSCVRPDHLYCGTPTQNAQDAIRRGRTRLGNKAKLSPSDVIAIRNATGTHSEIAEQFGISSSNVYFIRSRKTWRSVP